jgi:phosphoheptose isomerase
MARIDSLSIQLQTSQTAKDKLKEEYGKVIENVQKRTISALLKNKDLSGDASSGTMEAKRFSNATAEEYGTARSGGKANKIKAKPVVVALDVNKELIEEVEEKDLRTYGVNGLIERRVSNQGNSINRLLEREFFKEAVKEGTKVTLTATKIEEMFEEAILKVETTKNDFVDGVERDMINVVCSPEYYGKIRTYLDQGNNANVETDIEEFGRYHGVNVFSSVYLPTGVDFVVMAVGSVAQPVITSIYNPTKIELSDATAFGTFLYFGTKAVTPDLIIYKAETNVSL